MAHNTGTDRSGDKAVLHEAILLGSAFDPAALKGLQKAFEEAWSEVFANPIISTDEQSARDMIARRIVDAAVGQGIRDPARMKAYALQVFGNLE